MMPNFALHLSFDGITLDQRGPAGWVTVGKAEFTSASFAADLADLRTAGIAAAGDSGFTTKLVLPNDQVKLVTLRDDTPSRTSVGMALEGATPYAVSDLEFDWRVSGGKTHVAAVAKETLSEAEAFAREHDLAPAAFVCLPDDGWEGEEAFFGPVMGPGAVDVRRDPTPYVLAGSMPEPESELAAPAAEPTISQDSEDVSEAAPQTSTEALPSVETEPDTPPDAETEEPRAAPALTTDLVTEDNAPRLLGASAPDADEIANRAPRLTIDAVTQDSSASAPALGAAPASAEPVEAAVAAASLRPELAEVADADNTKAAAGGLTVFRSRRRAPQAEPADDSAAQAATASAPSQSTQAKAKPAGTTIFDTAPPEGARVGGKPRFLGLILTALLILALLAVAAFATGLSGDGLSRLFSTPDEDPAEVAALPSGSVPLPDSEMVADGAALDEIIQMPLEAEQVGPTVPAISDAELQRIYAATGIWQRAPDAPRPPSGEDLQGLYVASIDRNLPSEDAVALPDPRVALDTRPTSQALPPAADATFEVDDRGLVIATEEGSITPNGYTVIAGRPGLIPPLRVPSFAAPAETQERLASFRPKLRPDGLKEAQERADLGGFTRTELAAFRPRIRPEAAKQAAEAAAAAAEEAAIAAALVAAEAAEVEPEAIVASKFAVPVSARPSARPKNFDKIVASARKSQPGTVEQVAAVAPRTTRPSGPTRASVARAATTDNAINLRRVNLIGVYGKPSNRQALVRLANGRFVKVRVGDRVDGGKVAAIGESQIRYVKGGRNITLDIPS